MTFLLRGIIYFSHRHCCEVYEYFETGLGQLMFDQDKKERLVALHVEITSESCKKRIMNSFGARDGCLPIVIASIAFGIEGHSILLC